MKSASVFHGASARTANTVGSAVKRATGLSSAIWYIGARPRILSASGSTVSDASDMRIVYPSGLDLATCPMPMPPPAPGLLSTITGCFRSRLIASATGRATVSATPPGGNGTTIVMA